MKNSDSISLFKYHQAMLGRNTDLLHYKIENKDLNDIMKENNLFKFNTKFEIFRNEAISLISVTNKFKENILDDIENHTEYIDYEMLENSTSGIVIKK